MSKKKYAVDYDLNVREVSGHQLGPMLFAVHGGMIVYRVSPLFDTEYEAREYVLNVLKEAGQEARWTILELEALIEQSPDVDGEITHMIAIYDEILVKLSDAMGNEP